MQDNRTFDRKKYIKREDSKNALRTFSFSRNSATIFPDFDLDQVLTLIDSDPIARGAYTAYIDSFMEGGYAILDKKDLSYDQAFEQKLDEEYNFEEEVVRGFAIMGKFSKNVFLEIVRKSDNSVKALYILDSNAIAPVTKPNGDIIKYVGKVPNPLTGVIPEWQADEIVWYKLEDRKRGFATVDLKTLWNNLQAKNWLSRYVAWLFKTGQYRIIYNFKNASDKDVEDFLAYARRHAENFDAPFIAKGELESKVLRDMKEIGDLIALLKYYDSQTLVAMRMPPIDAGIPDASGRSNADAQDNSLSTHLTSMKKVFANTTNHKLFPLMNKGQSMIKFSPNNRFEEKQVIDNIVAMKKAGMTEEILREYLQDRGMFYGSKKLFDIVPLAGVPGQNDPNAASRQPKGPQGTGEAASTRPDQVGAQ